MSRYLVWIKAQQEINPTTEAGLEGQAAFRQRTVLEKLAVIKKFHPGITIRPDPDIAPLFSGVTAFELTSERDIRTLLAEHHLECLDPEEIRV